jgi:serine phosphatase RsbU (regulator of sigma subunit)
LPDSPASPPRRRRKLLGGSTLAAAAAGLLALFGPGLLALLGQLVLGALAVAGAIALLRFAWRKLFWGVGSRLALSYFLVGVLPLGLIALLVGLAGYLGGGFLLGHLHRDAVDDLRDELRAAALARLAGGEAEPVPLDGGRLAFARYRNGERVAGSQEAPASWPDWLEAVAGDDPAAGAPFVALADGSLSLAATAGGVRAGIVVWFEGDLGAALRERSRSWVRLSRSDDPEQVPATRIEVFGRVLELRGLRLRRDPDERDEFFRLAPAARPEAPAWGERPSILWLERTGPPRALSSGEPVAESVAVSLAASPNGLVRALRTSSERADSTAWVALAGIAVLLFEIWAVAAALALFMIVGLSRAVNRLTGATEAIGRGEFAYRIPARRRDQVGELQRSFNEMAAHLAELVETSAQKEALDKELALARAVQRDLLPDLIEVAPGLEIETMFEPSAAIGGDYFDVLRRPEGRLAVVVADVAGHGLAAGLRMAMVKSALTLLAEERLDSVEIFARLRRLLRQRRGERGFVTLTFAELEVASGEMTIANAGHPPCYLVRGAGEVEEVALPSPPLGALVGEIGRATRRLSPGDAMVWLSDGIPECLSPAGDPYGYERVERALAGGFGSAAELRDRLLADLRRHCGSSPVGDDRTLVVLRFSTPGAGAE